MRLHNGFEHKEFLSKFREKGRVSIVKVGTEERWKRSWARGLEKEDPRRGSRKSGFKGL